MGLGIMSWFTRKTVAYPYNEKIVKRVSKIATADLIIWIEQAVNETNRASSAYRGGTNPDSLEEMLLGAEALHCLIEELHKRSVVV
jgi:hypothetical protein